MANAVAVDLMSQGEHCSHVGCGQIDFLPFTCDACSQVFCLEHRTYTGHACRAASAAQVQTIVCPICAKAVKVAPGADVNAAFEAHTKEGNCDPANYGKVHNRARCPVPGCKEKLNTVNTYGCKVCGSRVCLKHRHGEDHNCEAIQAEQQAAAAAQRFLGATFSKLFRPHSANALSNSTSSTSTAKPRLDASQTRAAAQQQYMQAGNNVHSTAHRRGQPAVAVAPATGSRPAVAVAGITTALGAGGRDSGGGGSGGAQGGSGASSTLTEVCPQCRARFTSVGQLITHVDEYHSAAPASASGRAAAGLAGHGSHTAAQQAAHTTTTNPMWGLRGAAGSAAAPATTTTAFVDRAFADQGGAGAARGVAASGNGQRRRYDFECPRCNRGFDDAALLVRHTESQQCVPGGKRDGCTVS